MSKMTLDKLIEFLQVVAATRTDMYVSGVKSEVNVISFTNIDDPEPYGLAKTITIELRQGWTAEMVQAVRDIHGA